jgi:hypothetical protein
MKRVYLLTDYTWRGKVVNRGCGSNHGLSTFSSGQGKSRIEMLSHFIKHNLCRCWNAISNQSQCNSENHNIVDYTKYKAIRVSVLYH